MNRENKNEFIDLLMKRFEGYIKSHSELMRDLLQRIIKVEVNSDNFIDKLDSHLKEEMLTLEKINYRLTKIEYWKLKVTTLSGAVAALVSFIISLLMLK